MHPPEIKTSKTMAYNQKIFVYWKTSNKRLSSTSLKESLLGITNLSIKRCAVKFSRISSWIQISHFKKVPNQKWTSISASDTCLCLQETSKTFKGWKATGIKGRHLSQTINKDYMPINWCWTKEHLFSLFFCLLIITVINLFFDFSQNVLIASNC